MEDGGRSEPQVEGSHLWAMKGNTMTRGFPLLVVFGPVVGKWT